MENVVNDKINFLKISVYLTGFSEIELLGTGMVEAYFHTVRTKSNETQVQLFFEEVNSILIQSEKNEKLAIEAIRNNLIPDSKFDGIAKKIIQLWYLGTWGVENGMPKIISTDAYLQSLVWLAAETHPSGGKQPGFGSWSQLPKSQIK